MSIAKYFERDRDIQNRLSWSSFKDRRKIGGGTYGEVFKARDVKTGEIVVLKRVKYNHTLIREMEIMAKMNHVNVLKLKETFVVSREVEGGSETQVVLVFEFMDHDLYRLRQVRKNKFSPPEIKCYMQQLLLGLHYLHSNGVLHRDIKGENVLINNKGILKITDFGLSKSRCLCQKGAPLTDEVITLYYRPPELLLGQTIYGPEVDIWSVGCIFAEMFLSESRDRLFLAKNQIEQLEMIFVFGGMPNESSWPGVTKLPKWKNVNLKSPRNGKGLKWKNLNSVMDPYAQDLLMKMIQLCPSQRITAKEALDSEYFWTNPLPCHPSSIRKYGSTSTAEYLDERARQKVEAEERALKKQKISHPVSVSVAQGEIDITGGAGKASLAGSERRPGRGLIAASQNAEAVFSDLPPTILPHRGGRGRGGRGPNVGPARGGREPNVVS